MGGCCTGFGRKSGLGPGVFAVGVVCAREVQDEAEICGCAGFSLKRAIVVLGCGLVGVARGEEERSEWDSDSESDPDTDSGGMAPGSLLLFSLFEVGCLGKRSSWWSTSSVVLKA